MKLHNDREAFRTLLLSVAAARNMRADILEKDYYVVLMLKELSKKQDKLPAYFKGGTALYKALKTIRRFSEDIDLTVNIDDCATESAKKKRVEAAAKDYDSLASVDSIDNKTGSRSVTKVYEYGSLFPIADDPLQRFGRVRIEATSFTKSEPNDLLEIAPAIYDYTDEGNKKILREEFDVQPFKIATIKLERIFIDKIFAAEYYYAILDERKYTEAAKHLYDIAVLFALPEIQALLKDENACRYLVGIKREEESIRHFSDLSKKPFDEFTIYDKFDTDPEFAKAYNAMQRVYVPNAGDIIPIDKLSESVKAVGRIIKIWNF